MTVSAAIYERLSEDTDTAALVSTRIYPKVAPQDVARPYVVFHKTVRRPQQTLNGYTLSRGVWQIDAWSNTFDQSESIAVAIEAALDGFRGDAGSRALGFMLDEVFDDYEPDTRLYRQSLDFLIWDCGPALT